MKVLIVGAGVGGLAAAAFLESTDVDYEIIEKCPDWTHQGFVIGLWDNGRDILQKLALAESLDASGSRIQKYSLRDGEGNILREFKLKEFYSEFGGAVTIVGRKELLDLLRSKVPAEKIRLSTPLDGLHVSGDGVFATYSGEQKRYDVVIGADGVHSKVRSLHFGEHIESYTGWRAWYSWIDHTYDVPAAIVEYIEGGQTIVTFSSGMRTLMGLMAPSDHAIWDTKEGRIERLTKIFSQEKHLVPRAFQNLKDDDVLPTDLVDVNMRTFIKGRAALVGDAAHSFGPMAGLGSSIALEDGYTLAAQLIRASEGASLPEALSQYEKDRWSRVKIARQITMKLRVAGQNRTRLGASFIKLIAPFIPASFLTADYKKLLRNEI